LPTRRFAELLEGLNSSLAIAWQVMELLRDARNQGSCKLSRQQRC